MCCFHSEGVTDGILRALEITLVINGRTSSNCGTVSKIGGDRVFGAGAAMKAATGSGDCAGEGKSGCGWGRFGGRGSVEGFFRFDRIPGGGCGVEDDEVGL